LLQVLLCVLAVAVLAEASDGLGALRPSTAKTHVLAGRLTVCVPETSQSEAMQHGIMAAPESDTEQTRVVIDAGPQRMVLMVYELYARTGDLDAAAGKEAGRFPQKVNLQKWSLPAPLRAVAYFPAAPTKDHEANLVMGVFVAQADGSVQMLQWYVNPQGAEDQAGTLKLAQAIARTIAPGDKSLDAGAGEREMAAGSQAKSVFITVPEGYVVSEQRGVDFLVHHVHKITRFGEPSASIGIYLGDHPSNDREGFVKSGTSSLFGKKAQWYLKTAKENGETVLIADALVPLAPSLFGYSLPGTGDGPSYADVFLTAGDEATLKELETIAATVRIGNRKTR
jgi:hypothetical protein